MQKELEFKIENARALSVFLSLGGITFSQGTLGRLHEGGDT